MGFNSAFKGLSVENDLVTWKDGASSSKEGGKINTGRNVYQQRK
jgi:hypothetical protein